MRRMHTTVAILGGGLAGLCVARRLQADGIDFILVDARERLGGRILSTNEEGMLSDDGFDLGPSWFWPDVQPDIASLVQELGLTTFPQYSGGEVVFERMSREPAWRCHPEPQAPQSMRIAGGTGALISALAKGLPRNSVVNATRVTQLMINEEKVTLTTATAERSEGALVADQVVAAIPPRLLAEVAFFPGVEQSTAQRWKETATWMAPHAKFFAIYDRPFWREAGLSGTAQSFVGPMGEIHDATTASGKAALFGFLSVGADMRASIGEAALATSCLAQLARLYGPDALHSRATLFKDWAADPFTATAQDRSASGHPHPSAAPWIAGVWQNRLSLCSSETSAIEPGFMAGAVSAGHRAAGEVMQRLNGRGAESAQ